MRFWVDIEDSTGTLQGEGPIATAQSFEVTSRISKAGSLKLSMPGSDPRSALIVKKRIIRGKTMIGETLTELGAGSIDHIERRQNTNRGVTMEVSGNDLLRELVNRHVGELLIDDGAGGPDDDGPTGLMALAPSGWTLDTTEGYANSYKSIYHQYDGETVLEALINLSKITGEQFRLGSGRKVIWMRKLGSAKLTHSGITGTFTLGEDVLGSNSNVYGIVREATGGGAAGYLYVESVTGSFLRGETVTGKTSGATITVSIAYNPSSGIEARQAITPVAAEDNTSICIIRAFKEIEDSYETQIGRVYAIGAGNGDAKITLNGAAATPPSGYALGNDAKGYYLQHTTTWSTYGIERRKSFKDVQNANELYEQAFEYLSRVKDTNKAYEVEVTKLDQALSIGKTIKVVYQRWIEDPYTGTPFQALNVNAELFVLEATNQMDASGARSARLVVATVDQLPTAQDDASALTNVTQQSQQVSTHSQPVSGGALGAHKTSHQNGGSDELSVTGLSGQLADNQPPLAHKANHEKGGSDVLSGTIQVGQFELTQNVIRGVFNKVVTDNVATSIIRITTANEIGSLDGGGYSVFVHALIGHSVASNQGSIATKSYTAQFCRAMAAAGSGINSAVSEVIETASAATTPLNRDIGTVTMTVVETTEYQNDIQFLVDGTGSIVGTLNAVVVVELIWWGFATAPILSQL